MGRASRAIRHELRYWALRLLLGGARPLPLSSLRAGGALLGLAALALSRQTRRHVRHNLELAYPDQSDDWRDGLARRTARHAGKLLGEVAWLWSVGPRRLLARTRFEGLEHLRDNLAADRGVVLITGHCGNWEWMNLALGAAGVPMSVAARQVDDPRIDGLVARLRGANSKIAPAAEEEGKAERKTRPLAGTEVIISKNLFDPERGEGRNREVEANSRAFQRIRSMILLGTAILGNNRYAVLRDSGTAAAPGQAPTAAQAANLMRLTLGDNVEGFRLAEIGDKRVVFTRGASNVEVLLDYFRKADPPLPPRPPIPGHVGVPRPGVVSPAPVPGAVGAPQPPRPQVAPVPVPGQVPPIAPRVLPNLPRRERVPVPQRNEPQSEE